MIFRPRRVGAKMVGYSQSGNAIMKLAKSGALGSRGERILVAEDEVIFVHLARSAAWELEACEFLAAGLRQVSAISGRKSLLLDLGGHSGLVTLQTMNLAKSDNQIIIVEPMPRHVEAIRHNLKKFEATNQLQVVEYGLGERAEKAIAYRELVNWGNVSLLESAMPKGGHTKYEIELIEASKFFDESLANFESIVLKSDLQGFDAKVLSKMKPSLWAKVERAAIEVWALPEVEAADVDRLMESLQPFAVDHQELARFWKSGSGESRDLLLQRP